MSNQKIISIGREYGCGGRAIAEKIAEHYGLPLYDKNLLKEVAKTLDIDADNLEKYDEVPKNIFASRTVNGYSNSVQENIAHLQFDELKKKADGGESFVVVGRCAETVLKDSPALISIFVLGDKEFKIDRTVKGLSVSREEALNLMKINDKKRKSYHNYYCEGKWGDSRTYDITINTSKLGVDLAAKILIDYIDKRSKVE
jgi:cytidylate kinase